MRVVLVNALLGAAMGLVLGSAGIMWYSGHYWLITVIFVAAIVNSPVRRHD